MPYVVALSMGGMMADTVLRPLPPGWRWVRLGEVCEEDRRVVVPDSLLALQLPYLSLEHVESNSGRILKQPSDIAENEGKSTTFAFDARHVLYGKLRPYLNKVALPDFAGRCTTEIIPLLLRAGVDRTFLCWLLRRQETVQAAMQGKTGSRMPRASMADLRDLLLPLPPLPEQRRIAAILAEQMAAVERACAAAVAQLAAARALPAAYLRATFDSPEAREWPKRRLGEVCEVKGGKRLPPGTEFANGKTRHPYIRVIDFQYGTVKLDDLRYLDELTQAQISRYIIRRDDVYISIAGSIGIVGVIPDVLDGANLTENAARIVIRDNAVLSRDFLARFLLSPPGQEFIKARTNMVGQPKLALERIQTIGIPLPPLSVQRRIAAQLSEQMTAAERLRRALEEQLEAVNRLPAALLRRAFRGEL